MTEIRSSLGRRQIPNQQKEYIVDDVEQDEIQQLRLAEEEIKRQRQLKANPEKERMSESSKKRIEFLLNLTCLKKEVEINGTKFVLRTLKSDELRSVFKEVNKTDNGVDQLFELRRNVLARSLISIGSLSFNDFIDSDSLNDKMSFIDNMDEILAKLLHKAYDELFQESQSKYGIDTEEKQKELVEDLKK